MRHRFLTTVTLQKHKVLYGLSTDIIIHSYSLSCGCSFGVGNHGNPFGVQVYVCVEELGQVGLGVVDLLPELDGLASIPSTVKLGDDFEVLVVQIEEGEAGCLGSWLIDSTPRGDCDGDGWWDLLGDTETVTGEMKLSIQNGRAAG